MTDCPICHVKNDDDARFCAECGQRLSPAAPSQAAPTNLNPTAGNQAFNQAPNQPPNQFPTQFPNQFGQPPRQPASPPDPSNQPAQQPTAAAQPPRARLRSPLLAAEEFEEFEEFTEEPSTQPTSRGGGLRSPLLGGGNAGGPSYSGSERRQPFPAGNYEGTEKRKGGLRSPILSGGGDQQGHFSDYGYDYFDEEPVDEDDPTVLRSPLLSARRPLPDRSTAPQAPSGSHAEGAARGIQPEQAQQFASAPQSPSSSYTSLRSLSSQAQSAPVNVPPAPGQAPPGQFMDNQQQFGQQVSQNQSGQYQAGQNQPQFQPANPGTNQALPGSGPISGPVTGPITGPIPSPAANAITASPAQSPQGWPQPGGPTSLRNPQPAATAAPAQAPAPVEMINAPVAAPEVKAPAPKIRSRMFSQEVADEDELDYAPSSARSSAFKYDQTSQGSAGEPSPLPKIIGIVAGILLLLKAFAFQQFLGTEWRGVQWLVLDQIVAIAAIVCIMVLAFRTK